MQYRYVAVNSAIGKLGLQWYCVRKNLRVTRVLLPNENKGHFPKEKGSHRRIEKLCQKILHYAAGDKGVLFPRNILDWSKVSVFQKKVLCLEHRVPRGYVTTYVRLAKKMGMPKAARAVGQALANNPFPLIIPCHRAVRNDGSLGGYRGGAKLKRKLLEMEGVGFDKKGKVILDRIW